MLWYQYHISQLNEEEYSKWYHLLSVPKQQRVNHFCRVEDKKRTVAGEMLARQAISQWCHVPAQSIVFDKDDNGKPFAVGLPVEFNCSHSGDMVVCAVSEKPVGIDVEQVHPIDMHVAKRFCNETELTYLFGFSPCKADFQKAPDTEQLTRFFELWTAKEAYWKCIGTGITDFSALRKKGVLDIEKTTCHVNNYIITIIEDKYKKHCLCNGV